MNHKTIICEPTEFDKEYQKWKESLKLEELNGQCILKQVITHDKNAHYINYSLNWQVIKKKH